MSNEIECNHCRKPATAFNTIIDPEGELIPYAECKECEIHYFTKQQKTITKEDYITAKVQEALNV